MRRFAILLPLLLVAWAQADLGYTLVPEPQAQSVRVKLDLVASGPTEFRIPAWCPGYYEILDYQKKISDVKVTDERGKALPVTHPDSRAWRVSVPKGSKLTLSYRVLGDDEGLGFFGVNVRPHTAFVNGPAAFMYPLGRLNERVTLAMELPEGWDVATGMDSASPGTWTAGDYDELLDHPIQMGKFQRRTFAVEGIPFEAVFVSESQTFRPNLDEEARQLQLLSRPAIKMMGSAPFKRYVYLIHLAIGSFSGGLEHRASTVLAVPNTPRLRLDELATHELYHTWNVKHIRPKALGPFDYTQKVREPDLWFSEGVTDYYAHLHAYQAGIRTPDEMLRRLSDLISELQASQTRKLKTLEDAGREAWENGSVGTGDLSYYTKGAVAGLLLDAAIRNATDGARSLNDAMRLLFERHRLPKPGFEADALLKTVNEVAGADLGALYRRIVRSTEEMPYEALASLGLRVRIPSQRNAALGFKLEDGVVSELDSDVSGQGLRKGDRLLSVEERAFGPGCFAPVAARSAYQVKVQRAGQTLTLELKTKTVGVANPTLEFDPFADERADRLRSGWLKKP
jgi:predicted metalloprotease with PDZ domain